jgi:hypothetical protein
MSQLSPAKKVTETLELFQYWWNARLFKNCMYMWEILQHQIWYVRCWGTLVETMNSEGLREAGRDLFADIDIASAANNGWKYYRSKL